MFCFEVLEHLPNQLLLLQNITKNIKLDTKIFLSVPRHIFKFQISSGHYYEPDESRLMLLFYLAKLRIIDRDEFKNMLKEYYQLRGWDEETGLPQVNTLLSIGLDDILSQIRL